MTKPCHGYQGKKMPTGAKAKPISNVGSSSGITKLSVVGVAWAVPPGNHAWLAREDTPSEEDDEEDLTPPTTPPLSSFV